MRRWTNEEIALLAARAPRRDRALKKIAERGGEVVLIDGTLIPTRRRTGNNNRKNCSGKHKRHGLHFLAATDERARLIRISAVRPGRTHHITAARHDHIVDNLKAAGLGALADLGFLGLDPDDDAQVVVTGYRATRARNLTAAGGFEQAGVPAFRRLVGRSQRRGLPPRRGAREPGPRLRPRRGGQRARVRHGIAKRPLTSRRFPSWNRSAKIDPCRIRRSSRVHESCGPTSPHPLSPSRTTESGS